MRRTEDPVRFDDDDAFHRWVAQNPDGFVASAEVGDRAGPFEVHRAGCERLAPWYLALPRQHVRYCGPNRVLLLLWVRRELRVDPREDCACLRR